jgi:orotidine-5'-phosphate decarboxylase
MYERAAQKGVTHFIVPGNKIEAIKRYHILLTGLINEPRYCMPGIGTQGGAIEDAFAVLRGYPAYAIVGSAIYESSDITRAARRFAQEAMRFE